VGCAVGGPGRRIYLLGAGVAELEGSVFERLYGKNPVGGVPALDLDAEKKCSALCVDLVQQGLVTAAHDLSEGPCRDGGAGGLMWHCRPGARSWPLG